MNYSKNKYYFLLFGFIYLIGAFLTFYSKAYVNKYFSFLGIPLSKTQEIIRLFLISIILLSIYWKQRHK